MDYSESHSPDVGSITYDTLGRRTAATVSGVTETWAWDEIGRLREQKDANGRTTTYGWDAVSNLTSIGYPGQTTPVTRTFDDAGHLTAVTDWAGRTTSFAYDPNGNWTTTTFPTGTSNVDTRSYDVSDRMTGVTWKRSSTVLGSLSYVLDNEGMVDTGGSTGSAAPSPADWGYDDRDRLTSVGSNSLGLDPAGNLVETEDGRYATAAAFGVRAEQRIDRHGFSNSLSANLADAGLTYLTFGLGGAFTAAAQEWQLAVGVSYLGRWVPADYDITSLFGWLDEQC